MATAPPLGHFSTTPVFNTKAVARETEVPADTFRAWERRYGIPCPQRTAGGHRLYSDRDIAIIRWLRDRTAEGMNISQAVMLLLNSLSEAPKTPGPVMAAPPEPRAMQRLNDELLEAMMSFDAGQSERLLSEAFTLYPLEDVVLQLIQPVMVEVGERWHRGEISVAVEHFSTQYIRRKISGLLSLFEHESGRGKIIVACAPDELHDLGAMLVSLFLVRRGWHVIFLGAQVPTSDLLETIQATQPDLVCLSASMPETALQLVEVTRLIQEGFPNLQIGFGGRVFNINPELRSSLPGIYLGHDAGELVDGVATLFTRSQTSTITL